jgi:hypothetical protein
VVQYFGVIGISPKSLKPKRMLTDSFDNDLELSYDIEVGTGKTTELALIGTGSFTSIGSCVKEFRYMRDNRRRLAADTEKGFKDFSSSTLSARPPETKQNPGLARLLAAYDKAKMCFRAFQTTGQGTLAGRCGATLR